MSAPANPKISDSEVTGMFMGLTESEAEALAAENGLTLRVSQRDSTRYPMTMDYRTDRVTVVITNDHVTQANLG